MNQWVSYVLIFFYAPWAKWRKLPTKEFVVGWISQTDYNCKLLGRKGNCWSPFFPCKHSKEIYKFFLHVLGVWTRLNTPNLVSLYANWECILNEPARNLVWSPLTYNWDCHLACTEEEMQHGGASKSLTH